MKKIKTNMLVFIISFFLIVIMSGSLLAQNANPPGLKYIKESELKKDLYTLADAHFNGRSAGTLDELKASMWLAEKYRSIGLLPAGDDGTYLQFFNLWRNHISDKSVIKINNKTAKLWNEVAVAQMANATIVAPITYLGNAADIDTTKLDIKNKVVAIEASSNGINTNVSLPTWRYSRSVQTKYAMPLIRKGASAVIIIADDFAEKAWDDAAENFKRGNYDIDGGPNVTLTTTIPILWMHANAKADLQNNTAFMNANIIVDKYSYPSVNIIGKINGTDPKLKEEYLLYSGHQDAHGIRNVHNNDSTYYGADDNASVDVAMLANARAFIKNPAKRSILFVIHGAEERGLLGSRYYVQHPTVPIKNIVTCLNGDMIGRNNIDSAAFLGMQSPHKNSTELVNLILAANNEGPKFKLDTAYDKVTHVEGWYFRSDHVPYARLGIPAVMYTTLLHEDYHTPLDNAENINYPKLKKMADWMYRSGWKVANLAKRPATDVNFKLER
ncbi:MAG: M28 family metallopeptidase [Burkholderiaceae bacterium]